MRYSLHTDTPVMPMRPFDVVSSASNRLLPDGGVGAALRVSRLRALRALTTDAAWQAGLDHDRGTLSVGKRADLLLLSDDPLDTADVSDVKVDGVWRGVQRLYRRMSADSLQ